MVIVSDAAEFDTRVAHWFGATGVEPSAAGIKCSRDSSTVTLTRPTATHSFPTTNSGEASGSPLQPAADPAGARSPAGVHHTCRRAAAPGGLARGDYPAVAEELQAGRRADVRRNGDGRIER
jgi:hypothetical protein